MAEELDIKLGYLCNNNCIFCLNKDKRALQIYPINLLFQEIEKISEQECKKLVISGGEPLVSPNFWRVLEFARRRNIKLIEIQTNGRYLSNIEIVKRLKKFEPIGFLVSLHFPSREMYKKYCGADGFDEVIQGIKNLLKYNCDVTVSTVIMRPNVDKLEDLIELLISYGVQKFNYRFIDGKNVINMYEQFVPRFRECVPSIEEIIEKYSTKVKITLNEFPPCVFSCDITPHLAPCELERKNLTIHGNLVRTMDILNEQFIFPSPCNDCYHRGICKGIRKEYYFIYGDDELGVK